ncbi:MAG: alanine racemase [Fusicatenibacter sp.]|nr:alanine racemase [Lachnospiraceae bacterium]MDY2938947.1 alanine racemase [Fusicatenibacter sp.]
MSKYKRCYAEVSLEAIEQNINEVKKRLEKKVKLLVVVKADAYGHGAVKVAHCLEQKADYFAVATLQEAIELRENGIRKPILILGYVSPSEYEDVVRNDITQTVDSYSQALVMEKAAAKLGKRAKVHIAVDTGMTRIGFQVTEQDAREAARIAHLPHVELEGMFTHFSCADQVDKTYCDMQMEKYDRMTELLLKENVTIPIRHICNSAGIMEFDHHRFDMVRSGIITYGIYPSPDVKKERLNLIPALAWKCHVIHVKEVGPGLGVSYGATYVTSKPSTRIATVSVGYADGYPRALSNQGRVLIHGQFAPIIGRVCMDQMMVDVSEIPDVKVEDVVTLVGRDGENQITIEEVADPAARFDYEMLCNISKRVERVYDK